MRLQDLSDSRPEFLRQRIDAGNGTPLLSTSSSIHAQPDWPQLVQDPAAAVVLVDVPQKVAEAGP